MSNIPVNPASLPTPSGYSHGTLAGNTLYLGGQTALDADMKIVPGGIVAQFRQAFAQRPHHPFRGRRPTGATWSASRSS